MATATRSPDPQAPPGRYCVRFLVISTGQHSSGVIPSGHSSGGGGSGGG